MEDKISQFLSVSMQHKFFLAINVMGRVKKETWAELNKQNFAS